MIYSAYTQIFEEFPTFEAAVEYLENHPGSEGREPVAVLLLTDANELGAVAEQVDGVPAEPGESQVYRVTVAHEVFGKKFTIEYIVEFGAIPEEEEHGEIGEDGSEPGFGDEEDSEQSDEGTEEPGNGAEDGTPDEGGQPGEGTSEAGGEDSEGSVEAPVDELERWESDGGEPEPDEAE